MFYLSAVIIKGKFCFCGKNLFGVAIFKTLCLSLCRPMIKFLQYSGGAFVGKIQVLKHNAANQAVWKGINLVIL